MPIGLDSRRVASRRSSAEFAVIAAILLGMAAELFSWAALGGVLHHRKPWLFRMDFEAGLARVDTATLEAYRRERYDAATGWGNRPNTRGTWLNRLHLPWTATTDELGARVVPAGHGPAFAAAYGDSFTFGDEVDDDGTWPAQLSLLTGTRILNLGISGGGPDQALLALERNLSRGDPRLLAPVVILQADADSMGRLVNAYRPFVNPNTELPLGFKPIFRREGDGWQLVNPLPSLEGIADLRRAFAVARPIDRWAKLNDRRPEAAFPWSWNAVRLARYLLSGGQDAWTHDLHRDPEATAVFDHVLERFLELAERHRFVPVFLFIPFGGDLRELEATGSSSYQGYLDSVRRRYVSRGLRVVDVAEQPFDHPSFHLRPYDGHASPAGNRVVAEVLHEVLGPALVAPEGTNP